VVLLRSHWNKYLVIHVAYDMDLSHDARGRSERCWVGVGQHERMLKRGVVISGEVE
jgi:hypothetical protein